MAAVYKVSGNQKFGINFVFRKDGFSMSGLFVGFRPKRVKWEEMKSVRLDGQYAYINMMDGSELVLLFRRKTTAELRNQFRQVIERPGQ
jgi:hypothetical protein